MLAAVGAWNMNYHNIAINVVHLKASTIIERRCIYAFVQSRQWLLPSTKHYTYIVGFVCKRVVSLPNSRACPSPKKVLMPVLYSEKKSGYVSYYPQWSYGNARDCQYINPFMEIMLRVLKKKQHLSVATVSCTNFLFLCATMASFN